jgi:hypothetical protein
MDSVILGRLLSGVEVPKASSCRGDHVSDRIFPRPPSARRGRAANCWAEWWKPAGEDSAYFCPPRLPSGCRDPVLNRGTRRNRMGRDGNSFPSNYRDFSAKIACVLSFLGSLLPYSTPAGDTTDRGAKR